MKIGFASLLCAASVALPLTANGGSYFPPAPDQEPVFSPDGKQVAYFHYATGSLRVVNVDGTGDRPLLTAAMLPSSFAFSPDWKRVAFVTGSFTVDVANVDGSARTTVARGVASAAPAFSPDGSHLAYATTDGVFVDSLRVANAQNPVDLTWSPDGIRLAYTVNASPPHPPHVEVARADGSGVESAGPTGSLSPAWSPDSRTLAFFVDKTIQIGLTGVAYSIPGVPYERRRPVWSRDGLAVYFLAAGRVYRLDLVTGREDEIGLSPPDLAFAPDFATYAYSATGECGDRRGIYVGSRRLTNDCHVYGTDGADRLVSSGRLYEIVDGRGGNDVITGRGAPYIGDELIGGAGNDVLRGGYWPDQIEGGSGNDALYGGVDGDGLNGGPGRDRIDGQGGSDFIDARDGERDYVDCGKNIGKTNTTPERDTAYVDRFDVVRNCEKVVRSK